MFGRGKPKPAKPEAAKSTTSLPAKPAQTTWYGRLEKQQMIGVVWVLHGEDEQQYELRGVAPEAALDAQRVAVTGVLAEAGFGMQMVGTPIDVATIEAAPVKG
ncbi:MAG: hypothetical protein ACI9U2_001633 [Bradymonadia bacterium]|jgi:hypothetical protein